MKRRVLILSLFILLCVGLAQIGILFSVDLSLAQCAKDDVSKQCISNGYYENELSVKEAERVYLSYNEDFNNLNRAIDKLNKI